MSGIDFSHMLQGAADFTNGFFNALGSDEVLGAGRRDQPTSAGKVGAAFGDATATIQGLSEFTGGLGAIGAGMGGEALGIGLDATGVGILPGVVINVASAGLVVAGTGLAVHGGAVALTGAAHLGTDTAQLTHLAMTDASGARGGSGPDSGQAKITLRSRISESSYATRQAQAMNQAAQRDVDHLLSEFAKGNPNPGIGTRAVGNGFLELRGKNGGRVIVKKTGTESFDIVGKFQGHVKGDTENSRIIQNLIKEYKP